jgi:hypothetical protein
MDGGSGTNRRYFLYVPCYFFSNAVQFNTTVYGAEALWFSEIGMRNRSPFPVISQKPDAEREGKSRLGTSA